VQRIRTRPSAGKLNGLEKRVHRDLVSEQCQFRHRNAHAELYLVGTQESTVAAHDAHVVTQCRHESRTERVAVDGADRGYGQCDQAPHQRHELGAEYLPVSAAVFVSGA